MVTHRTDVWLLAGLVALSLSAVGCQEEGDRLEGSVSDRYDLSFSHTRARLYDSELSIEYVREDEQVPVRVTVDRGDDVSLEAGTYDLKNQGDVRGRVDQVKLPALFSGQLEMETFSAEDGAAIAGRFDTRLTAADSRVTLRGEFTTELEVVDEEIGYRFDTGTAGDAGDVAADADDDGGGQ